RYGCMIASFTSVEARKRNLWLERKALELERSDSERVDQRRRLAGPRPVIELVEGNNGALRHARHEVLDRAPGRLVEIEIEVEQRHDEMRIAIEVLRDGLQSVASDQLDLRDMAERPVQIEDRGAPRDVVGGVGRQAAGDGTRVRRRPRVARRCADESLEG